MADPTRAAAIEDLLAHAEWLRRLARRLVGSDDVASDVEQETWLAAIEHPPRDASSPRKWLAQVLRNIVSEHRRSERARQAREASAARPEAVAGGDELVDRAQALRALIEGVLELDEPYRSTLLLRYQEGLSNEAISSRLGLPSSTVRNRISRGIAQLRERLERRHGRAWSAILVPLVHYKATAAATAGGAALGASVAAFTSMATLKIVSAAAAVLVVGAAMWWTFSNPGPAIPRTALSPSEAQAAPALAVPGVATTPERSVAEGSKGETPAQTSAHLGTRGSLVVTVTWESDGSPASDVAVHVHPFGDPGSFAFASSRSTDDQGRVRFDDVASGLAIVETDRSDGEAAQVRGGEETAVSLKIERGVLVRGRVVDGAERPIGFARIWLSAYGNTREGSEVAQADAVGRFVLRDVGKSRQVAAYAAGHAPSNGQHILGKPGDEVEVTVHMRAIGGELGGTVRGPDGALLAGAALLIGSENGQSVTEEEGVYPSSPPPRRLMTDEHGEFAASGIAVGRADVQCRAQNLAPFAGSVDVVAEGVTRLAIDLHPGAAIEGLVRGADGKPANKVQLLIGDYGDFASSTVTTAADGLFHMGGLAPGHTEIHIRGDAQGQADTALKLVAGETARLDVQLKKHGIVAGRVVDENGAPLAGLRVGAITADHPGLHYRTSVTDAEGKFTLDNWPEKATALEVREEHRWTGPPALFVGEVEIGRTDLVLTVAAKMLATASAIGRLRGPQGEVVPDATLDWGTQLNVINMSFNADVSATTGDFRAGPMPAGRYRFQARSPSFGVLDLGERELAAEQTLDLGLVRFAEPGRVRVKLVGAREVLDTVDAPNTYAQVIGSEEAWLGQITFDSKLEGLSGPLGAGPRTIRLWGDNFRALPTPVEVLAGQEIVVEIALERATERNFRVTWGSGAPPTQIFDFIATDAAGVVVQRHKLTPQRDGSNYVGLSGLVVGTYWIDVKTTDGRSAHVSCDVRDLTPLDAWIEIQVR